MFENHSKDHGIHHHDHHHHDHHHHVLVMEGVEPRLAPSSVAGVLPAVVLRSVPSRGDFVAPFRVVTTETGSASSGTTQQAESQTGTISTGFALTATTRIFEVRNTPTMPRSPRPTGG